MNGRSVRAQRAGLTRWLRYALRNQWIEADAVKRAEKQAIEDRETENNIIAMMILFSALFHNAQHQARYCPA